MKRLIAMAFTGTICLGALAACGGDDSSSASDVQKANTEFCQDLTAYTTSLKTLAGLTATSTKAQYQNAVNGVKDAREDLVDSAKKLSEAGVANLQTQVDGLKDQLKDAPDDQAVAGILAAAQPEVAKVQASAGIVNTAICTPGNATTTTKS